MDTNDFPAPFAENGWVFIGWCSKCSRTKVAKFTNPDFPSLQIKYKVKERRFKILNQGMTKLRYTNTNLLESVLKSLK